MHKSIFSRFFNLCVAIIISVIILISSVHVFLSLETYHRDRKDMMSKYTADAAEYVKIMLEKTDSDEMLYELCGNYFSSLSYQSGIDFFLADSSGVVRSCSENKKCIHTKPLTEDILNQMKPEGTYRYSNLGGYYRNSYFNLGYSIENSGRSFYLIGSLSSQNMKDYLFTLMTSFGISSLIILSLVFPLLYFSIMKVVKPIREMTMAAQRFGEGDFSQKLEIMESNELGYLASSLNDMASSLESIEENRKRFISNVSHELKTPMTTIGGFVDGILDGTIPKSQHNYYLRIVSEEVDRLARLVRSMLNISKYESGETELQTESFDASALILKTVLLFEKRINDKKVDITGLDSERFYLNADIDLTQQVIYNLTENAVKFVNEGGYIDFSHESADGYTAIRIRNSGEGLKAHEISKVFERFYKTDESRGKDKTGVGLGLSIVRSIIKLHGGTVLVRSEPGQYTEFEFTFPTGSPPPKRAEQSDE